MIVLSDDTALAGEDAIHGVPAILLEVLSSGNANHDLVREKELYQKYAVRQYWVTDPNTGETTGFILRDGHYENPIKNTGKIKSPLLRQEFAF